MDKEYSNEYPKVRALTRKDRRELSELIKALAERSGDSRIINMVPGMKAEPKAESIEQTDEVKAQAGEAKNAEVYELVKSVMTGLLSFVEAELTEWFMDLLGISSREEYDKLPFDIEVYIIDQLLAQNGFNNFFSRVSALYKKIRG